MNLGRDAQVWQANVYFYRLIFASSLNSPYLFFAINLGILRYVSYQRKPHTSFVKSQLRALRAICFPFSKLIDENAKTSIWCKFIKTSLQCGINYHALIHNNKRAYSDLYFPLPFLTPLLISLSGRLVLPPSDRGSLSSTFTKRFAKVDTSHLWR